MIILAIIWIFFVEFVVNKFSGFLDSFKVNRVIIRLIIYSPAFYYALPNSLHPTALSSIFRSFDVRVDSVSEASSILDKFDYHVFTDKGKFGIGEFEYVFGRTSDLGEDESIELEVSSKKPAVHAGDSLKKKLFSMNYTLVKNPISKLFREYELSSKYFRLDESPYGFNEKFLLFGFKGSFEGNELINISKPYIFFESLRISNESNFDSALIDLDDHQLKITKGDRLFTRKINYEKHPILVDYYGRELNHLDQKMIRHTFDYNLIIYRPDTTYSYEDIEAHEEEVFRDNENILKWLH